MLQDKKLNLSLGFTLVELVVVIAIVGILAALSIGGFNIAERQREQRDLVRISALGQYASAMEMYYADNKSYPSVTGTTDAQKIANLKTALGSYNANLPTADPSSCPLKYTLVTGGQSYSLILPAESKGIKPPVGQSIERSEGCGVFTSCSDYVSQFKLSR